MKKRKNGATKKKTIGLTKGVESARLLEKKNREDPAKGFSVKKISTTDRT